MIRVECLGFDRLIVIRRYQLPLFVISFSRPSPAEQIAHLLATHLPAGLPRDVMAAAVAASRSAALVNPKDAVAASRGVFDLARDLMGERVQDASAFALALAGVPFDVPSVLRLPQPPPPQPQPATAGTSAAVATAAAAAAAAAFAAASAAAAAARARAAAAQGAAAAHLSAVPPHAHPNTSRQRAWPSLWAG